jgi:hypothetical protein
VSPTSRLLLWLSLAGTAASGCVRPVVLASQCPSPELPCSQDDEAPRDDGAVVDAGVYPALDAQLCASSLDGACGCEPPVGARALARWSLDETAGRIAANASSADAGGVLQGFGEENPWRAGRLGGALAFDGVDDRVQLGPVGGQVKTVALWLQPDVPLAMPRQTAMQLPNAHGPRDEWTAPENAYLDDGKLATVASVIGTKAQHWGGFQLAQLLPPSATILGISVTVDTGNLGVLGAFTVELSSDGGQTHTDQRLGWGQFIGGSDLRQAGGPDTLWGRSWTAADFSDQNFRVWGSFGGIANSMGLDFLAVAVHYLARSSTVLALSSQASITLRDGKTIASVGWPGSSVFVNGRAGDALSEGWNQVVIVSQTGISASDVQLGNDPTSYPGAAYRGLIDDVALLDVALTPAQAARLYEAPGCGP